MEDEVSATDPTNTVAALFPLKLFHTTNRYLAYCDLPWSQTPDGAMLIIQCGRDGSRAHIPVPSNSGCANTRRRCVDYVFYYPNQKLQAGGACGLAACGGSLQASAFDADSDFNRTFGVVDTCTTDVAGDGEVSSTCPFALLRQSPRRGRQQTQRSASSLFLACKRPNIACSKP